MKRSVQPSHEAISSVLRGRSKIYYVVTILITYHTPIRSSSFVKQKVRLHLRVPVCYANFAMARPPNPKHADHPLRLLRSILGISQRELAETINTPFDTIQSTELGRLQLSQAILRKIEREIGASWGGNEWISHSKIAEQVYSRVPKQFSRNHYFVHRAFLEAPGHGFKVIGRKKIKTRIDQLVDRVPRHLLVRLLFHLSDFLDKARQDFVPSDRVLERAFESTSIDFADVSKRLPQPILIDRSLPPITGTKRRSVPQSHDNCAIVPSESEHHEENESGPAYH